MMVAAADVISDGPHQLADVAEGSTADALVGDLREESFHQIKPRSTRGSEVAVIARMLGKPGLYRRMGVGAIVVQYQMDGHSNIDRIAKEGALFTDFYGQQSCTAAVLRLLRASARCVRVLRRWVGREPITVFQRKTLQSRSS
jgi:hypothetical protein